VQPRHSLAIVAILLVLGALWLWWQDGTNPSAPVTPAPAPPAAISSEARAPAPAPETYPPQHYVLALSWQPAFCETRPGRRECREMRTGDYAADNFSLHGLWPQGDEYCGVSQRLIDADNRSWNELPRVELSGPTRSALERVMPGTRSNLDRHEWIVHGTCSGATAERYYAASIALVEAINNSAVRDLLAGNPGQRVTRAALRSAFDQAFGAGAGRKVRLDCADDDGRQLALELRINLYGDAIASSDIAALMKRARDAGNGCAGGIVDRPGDQ
jgi:ribonuclease T2